MIQVPVENNDKETELQTFSKKYNLVEVEQVSWIPMENGKMFDGPLYIKKSENPGYNYPQGINGVYLNITAAISDFNNRGVNGPTRFLLNDASYSTENLPITIDVASIYVPTAVNTLTIKPNARY